MALIEVSSSISQIDPSQLFPDGFELSTQSIIPSQDYSGSFTPNINNIEFYIYDAGGQIQHSNYNFTNYNTAANTDPDEGSNNFLSTNEIVLTPEQDVYNMGYTNGLLTAVYNFVNHELSSSIENPYYLAEISSDRTEIRLKSNYISNEEIQSTFIEFNQTLRTTEFFDEFYISFGNNENHIGVNTQIELPEGEVDGAPAQYSILIKLYDALPSQYVVGEELYVVTKTGETQAFQIEFEETINVPDDVIKLKGPNTNLNVKDFVNNSSTYKSKDELINTKSSSSKDELLNVLKRDGIHLTPNYSSASFNEFINFSSAKSRINNFYTKVKNIQTYENDIRLISATTSSLGGQKNIFISSSIASLWTKIEDEIKNFDGYEYYQYYNTSSDAYPKNTSGTGTVYPYELLDYDSSQVLTWLGSNDPNNQYYGGMNFSASFYDENNENWLYYTIPSFITEQNDNDNYVEFCNMVGQSFDELWLYTKTITEKLNTTNQLDKGVPLSLADDVITSLGYTGFGNNYNNQDNFIGLIGNDDGSYVPPTGSELINHYIAINLGTVINYWDVDYSWEGYVEQLISSGFPYPIDKVSKEIFKRLYHNMSYLVKKKGTVAGLRQLINIWGIPSTILRINEFGGKNKDETDDYDLWYQRYSYAFTPVGNSYRASASAVIPWMPLERNKIADAAEIVPDGVGFRFKTTGYPSSSYAGSFNSQSLAVKKSDGADNRECYWGIALYYTGSTSGSYSGSSNSDYFDYGEMRFYISGAVADGGTAVSDPIYLPFFDKGWWTVLLQKDVHSNNATDPATYTLFVKNKLYDGADGNSIGFTGSATISNNVGGTLSQSINLAWGHYGSSSYDGVTLGGRLNGSQVGEPKLNENGITNLPGFGFSGSFQEFRYYSNAISESVFNDTVMNPESIEGNEITGSEASFDIVNFRAPLGNELENIFTSSQLTVHEDIISSSHPAITASAAEYITGSFYNPKIGVNPVYFSNYTVHYEANTVKRTYSKTNIETYFLDQPAIGVRNRVTNKIQATSNLNFGTALSNTVSIQTDPFISQSYTENINQLEVAFSPQDEINDDIIASLGYGAIQEAIADPRFRSQSADSYPKLDAIADDYFRKYVGSDIFDYLRLIKYFDDSLFRAIKNYVPARTSVSTGIVIKQNMLERNRYREPQVDSYTTQSYAITNTPLTTQNLELTGSVNTNQLWDPVKEETYISSSDIQSISGGAGGSVNEYNITSSQSGRYSFIKNGSNETIPAGGYYNLNTHLAVPAIGTPSSPLGNLFGDESYAFGVTPIINYLQTNQPVKAHLSIYVETDTATSIDLIVSSSERGELSTGSVSSGLTGGGLITPLLDILPGESIGFFLVNNHASSVDLTDYVIKTYEYTNPPVVTAQLPVGDISSSWDPSTQAYIKNNITTLGLIPEIESFQEEFYDGEYSGSAISTLVSQSNPYKSLPPSSLGVLKPGAVLTGNIIPTTTNGGVTPSIPIATTTGAGTGARVIVTSEGGIISKTEIISVGIEYEVGDTLTLTQAALNPYFGTVSSDIVFTLTADDFIQEAFIPWDLNVINNYNILTSGSFNISNTQSLIFENSDYNPLNNNAEYIRRSTNHYQLRYDIEGIERPLIPGDNVLPIVTTTPNLAAVIGPFEAPLNTLGAASTFYQRRRPRGATVMITNNGSGGILSLTIAKTGRDYFTGLVLKVTQATLQSIGFTSAVGDLEITLTADHINYKASNEFTTQTPSNLQNIIGVMYNPLSSSAKALVPDSNYTQISTLNPTYRGSKIQSLDYNNYTPSGSVGVINSLPPAPNNQNQPNVSYSIADNFLDGSTKFWETDNSQSWGGDNVANRLTAAIDKHPQYIAHFERSFEQTNYYNSREFKIDSLISISMDNLSGQEITPVSIDIDGRNMYKKWVSSIFEPNRGVGISYTTLNSTLTSSVYLETSNNNVYDLLGGSIQFLTLNANAKNRDASSNAYFYTRGDSTIAEIVFAGNITGSLANKYNPNNPEAGGIIISGSGGSVTASPGPIEFGGPNVVNTGIGTGGSCTLGVDGAGSVNEINFNSILIPSLNFQPGDTITIPSYNINIASGYSGFASEIQFTIPNKNIQTTNTNFIGQNLDTIQMVTASQITGDGQQYGFLLSGSNTTGSEGTFLLPFSQDQAKSGFAGLPNASKLSIGGPQLAVFHSYNQLVASQSVRPALVCPADAASFISESQVWVLEGIDPSSEDSYYQWAPSASDCPFYEDNKEAYLIERGDVLRVEGIKSLLTEVTDVTSSIEFVEDFTVTEIQNFYYSSSDPNVAPANGTLILGSGPVNIISSTTNYFDNATGYPLNNTTGTTETATVTEGASTTTTNFQTNESGVGGTITITSEAAIVGKATVLRPSSFEITVTGTGYAIGDTITITAATINNIFATSPAVIDSIIITLDSGMVASGGLGNNFTVQTDLDPGCTNPTTSTPYGQGYITYSEGNIGLRLPTFLKTDRNPSIALEGLQGGAVTKFTLIRQVENEQKVMIKNLPPTKGSKGFLTQTGDGYLIPDDLSPTQQENALNIINQLRQKNAVPTPGNAPNLE